jgi:hypothetical protein
VGNLFVKSRILLLMTTVAAVVLAPGHARAKAQEPGKDAESSYEPRSRPGAGQKYLESFVGDWDVVKVFYPRSGEPVRTRREPAARR